MTTPSMPRSNSSAIKIALASILILVLLALGLSENMNALKEFIGQNGALGLIFSLIVYMILGATLIPSEPLTIFIAAFFGPWTATLIAGLGNTLAAITEYYLGAKIGDAARFAEKKEKLPLGLGKLPIHSPLFLIAGRLIPGYGPKLVSVLSGAYRVPLFLYIWTTAIPTFIGAWIFAFGGKSVLDWFR